MTDRRSTPGSLDATTVDRIARALTPKVSLILATTAFRDRRQLARHLIATVVTDVDVILSGTVPIETWETEQDATVVMLRPDPDATLAMAQPRPHPAGARPAPWWRRRPRRDLTP